MDGNSKLTRSTLRQSLNVACASLAHYLECETGEITADQIAALPDFVFNMAVYAGWIPEPTGNHEAGRQLDPDQVWLGHFAVLRTFREEFISLIQEALDDLEPYNAEIAEARRREEAQREMHIEELRLAAEEYNRLAPVVRPTATELMDTWRNRTGHSLEKLASDAGVSNATLYRIRAGQFSYTTSKGTENLKCVAAVIGCDWQDLVPTSADVREK